MAEGEAWVWVGDQLCLVDPEGTRLPGDYQLEDRARSRLLVIAGVDLPVGDGIAGGMPAAPRAGEKWASGKDGSLGADMAAAMALVERLKKQPFAWQIDAVDMTNFNGRKDARAAWITLRTVAPDGAPRVVRWGRPIGEEKYYEVQADAKIKALNELYRQYSRIDAGRDYVDIRTEQVLAAKPVKP